MATETKIIKKPAIEAEESQKVTTTEKKAPERKKSKEIDLHALIPVRNLCSGGLSYISPKTNLLVQWAEYGDVEYMEFGELMTMKASKRRFLFDPLLMVEDVEVAEKLGLIELYEQVDKILDIDNFLRQSVNTIAEITENLPKGSRELLKDEVSKRILNGSLYDIRKIKTLENILCVDLQILLD